MSNDTKQQGPEVAGAVLGDHEPDDSFLDPQTVKPLPPLPDEDKPADDAADAVTLAVENPFYYDSVVLPDAEVEDDEGNKTQTYFTVTRGGTEVPADRADELTEAAAALGVTLSRSN